MPRLTPADWKHIRARYEVEGESQNSLAKEFGIHVSAVNRRAAKEGWEQAKYQNMSKDKANAIATIARIDEEKSKLPVETQKAIDFLARRELELQDISVDFRRSLLSKGKALIAACTDPGDLLTLAKAHSETVRPSATSPSTVNQIAIGDVGGKGEAKGGPSLEVVLNGVSPKTIDEDV